MRRYWRAYLRYGIGTWILMSGGAVLCAATGYAWEVGYGLLWWAGLYWPLVLAVWLLVLLGLTAARAARAAVRSAKAT